MSTDDQAETPEGWAIVKLADGVVKSVQPGFAFGAHNRAGEGVPHLRPMNVSAEGRIDLSDVKYVPASELVRDERWIAAGDVLFNNTNSPELVGKTAVYIDSTPRAFSNHMTRIRCRADALDSRFCALALHHLWQLGNFEKVCNNHVSQASISRAVLLDTEIPLPPLAEQQRIVGKVEALLAWVQATRQRLARVPLLLKRFRQAILTTACNGRLTADWREAQHGLSPAAELISSLTFKRKERYAQLRAKISQGNRSAPRQFDNFEPSLRSDIETFDLPDCWQWVDLRFLMSVDECFCYGVVQPGEDDPGGNFLVRAGDLRNGTIDRTNLRHISQSVDSEYERSRLTGGELLVTVVGAGIGTVAIAPLNCAGFNIARAVAKIPIRDVSAKYVFDWLISKTAYSWMFGDAREVARPTLNLEQLKTIPVPLPPLAEQQVIVRRVDALFELADAIERRVAAATARADKLTQSILAKAFRGELVPTEADLARQEGRCYETAAQLLEKVRSSPVASLRPTKGKAR